MKNYELDSNEVVLYKGNVTSIQGNEEMQLILTNLNIVFLTMRKKVFDNEDVIVDVYPVTEIKMYNGVPQIKVNGNIAEIYLLTIEKEIQFPSKGEINKFRNEVTSLLTHKTKAERCAQKVKNAIELVKDTIGEDGINAIKSVVGVVGTVENAVKESGAVVNKAVGFVNGLFKKKNKPEPKSITEKSE